MWGKKSFLDLLLLSQRSNLCRPCPFIHSVKLHFRTPIMAKFVDKSNHRPLFDRLNYLYLVIFKLFKNYGLRIQDSNSHSPSRKDYTDHQKTNTDHFCSHLTYNLLTFSMTLTAAIPVTLFKRLHDANSDVCTP